LQNSKNPASPDSGQKGYSTLRSFVTKSYQSPDRNRQQNYNYSPIKSSDQSLETFLNSTSSEHGRSFKTLENPLFNSQKDFPDTSEYKKDLKKMKKENYSLKSKIEKMKEFYSTQKLPKTTIKPKNKLIKKSFKYDTDRERSEMIQEYQKEFESVHDQIVKRLKVQLQKKVSLKEQELQEAYEKDLISLSQENKHKINSKISEIEKNYQNQLKKTSEELVWLRRENASLKSQLELATNPTNKNSHTERDSEFQASLYISYNKLQKDCMDLKSKLDNALCRKCKAFAEADENLSKKISRIRDYIGTSPC
jgi:hypothetical protein